MHIAKLGSNIRYYLSPKLLSCLYKHDSHEDGHSALEIFFGSGGPTNAKMVTTAVELENIESKLNMSQVRPC